MQKGSRVLAKGEDAKSHKFEFRVGCSSCVGRVVDRARKVHQVLSRAAGVLRYLEKDLVNKRCGYVGHRKGRYRAEDTNCSMLILGCDCKANHKDALKLDNKSAYHDRASIARRRISAG